MIESADPLEKSKALLLEYLNPEQRHEFLRDGKFTLESKGEKYELRPDITERLSDKTRFCAIIPGLPIYDQMLARKLHLEHDPDTFFKVANKFDHSITAEVWSRRVFNEYVGNSPFGLVHVENNIRVALIHEFRELGMDRRFMRLFISQVDFAHAYRIEVEYARRYIHSAMIDVGHFRRENFGEVLRQVARMAAHAINELVDRDAR